MAFSWYSVSFTNKTDITETLLKVALNTTLHSKKPNTCFQLERSALYFRTEEMTSHYTAPIDPSNATWYRMWAWWNAHLNFKVQGSAARLCVHHLTYRAIFGDYNTMYLIHINVFVFLLVSVPRLYSAVDGVFEPRSGQTKGYTIGSCGFSAQHAAWMRKSEEWLGRNHNNMFEWGDMHIHGLVSVSLHYTNSTMRVGLVQSGSLHHLIGN